MALDFACKQLQVKSECSSYTCIIFLFYLWNELHVLYLRSYAKTCKRTISSVLFWQCTPVKEYKISWILHCDNIFVGLTIKVSHCTYMGLYSHLCWFCLLAPLLWHTPGVWETSSCPNVSLSLLSVLTEPLQWLLFCGKKCSQFFIMFYKN